MTGPRNYPARLGVHNLGGATVAVVHITAASIQNFGGSYLDNSNQKLALEYAEFPGLQHVLNRTSYELLRRRYGEPAQRGDYRLWVGKLVVLAVTDADNFSTGEKVKSVWVADDKTWQTAYSQWSRGAGKGVGGAAQPTEATAAATAPKPRRRPAKKASDK